MKKSLVLLLSLIAFTSGYAASTKIVSAYFGIFDGTFSTENLQSPQMSKAFTELNRLYIAFAWIRPDSTGKCVLAYEHDGDGDKIDTLVSRARQANPSLEILIASGYDNGSMYRCAAKDPDYFAASVMQFLSAHQLNGYDIDWENGIDKLALDRLLVSLRTQFQQRYKLTLAVWPWPVFSSSYDIPVMANTVDQINVMTYGVYRTLNTSAYGYVQAGMPSQKIIPGIVTEFRYWEAGGPDTLGDKGSIEQKAQFVKDYNLAGLMNWRLDNDYTNFAVSDRIASCRGLDAMATYLSH